MKEKGIQCFFVSQLQWRIQRQPGIEPPPEGAPESSPFLLPYVQIFSLLFFLFFQREKENPLLAAACYVSEDWRETEKCEGKDFTLYAAEWKGLKACREKGQFHRPMWCWWVLGSRALKRVLLYDRDWPCISLEMCICGL